ncbi:hypothetical protein [Sphaerobacter thermophilus]|jgi:hypothetical protein|uniref:hypothetical protein n=1 Tax=Sphaerobacter thermophilus TaxID=2057 RepID=UPI000DB7D84A|nr:MAG: hypothetical protein DIU58_07795 [Sphaerobacter thermophilus]
MSDQPPNRPDAEQHQEARERSYAGPYETGPLGEPIDEPIPRGTLILLGLFLVVLVVLWLFAYLAVWNRGVA